MKKTVGLLALCLLIVLCARPVYAGMEEKKLDVVFMHDIHSHIEETVDENGDSIGGIARIRTIIDGQKARTDAPTLVLDAGDFSMGTLYQTIYTTQASELRLLGNLGVEVTTFGNHEFDYRTDGVISMLRAAKESGEALPELVASNIVWSGEDKEDSEPYKLRQAFEEYGGKAIP